MMSEDLIRRSDAIKAIASLHILADEEKIFKVYADNPHSMTTDFEGTLIDAINAIKGIPTIEPIKWIPCSERLPSENGRYLVVYPMLINKPWVSILWYGKPIFPEKDEPCFYASDDEYGDVEYSDVIAWMPLPKPYGEREVE